MLENCLNCGGSISEKARFCGKCGSNVRCTNCGEDLTKGAVFCEACGQDSITRQNQNASSALNRIQYSDAKKGITLDAQITDTFGANAAAVVGMLRGGQSPIYIPNKVQKTIPGQGEIFEPAEVVSNDKLKPELQISSPSEPVVPHDATQVNSANTLISLFEERDGEWFFTNPNIKAKNKADFFKKATCLYLQFQFNKGAKSVSKDEIKKFLDNYDAYDSNYRKWLVKEKTLLRVTSNDLAIIFPGSQLVTETLAEITDDSVQSTWKIGTVRKSGRKSNSKKQSVQPDFEEGE